jgi:hypothetical protein
VTIMVSTGGVPKSTGNCSSTRLLHMMHSYGFAAYSECACLLFGAYMPYTTWPLPQPLAYRPKSSIHVWCMAAVGVWQWEHRHCKQQHQQQWQR